MAILMIPLSLSLLFHDPMVQTLTARMFTQWVSQKTNYSLNIGKINVNVLKGIELNDVKLFGPSGDTILLIGNLDITPIYLSFFHSSIVLLSVNINKADFRLGYYKGDKELEFTNFIHSFPSFDTVSNTNATPFLLKIKKLTIANARFKYFDKNDTAISRKQMNFSDIDVKSVFISARNFQIINDSLSFHLNSLSGIDRCGFHLVKLKSDITISHRVLYFLNTIIETPHSFLSTDYKMDYKSWNSFVNFNDSVYLTAIIRPSTLNLSDIGYFSKLFLPMKNILKLSGEVEGHISNLFANHLNISSGNHTRFKGNIRIKGLPDFYTSNIDAIIQNFQSSLADLHHFKLLEININKIKYLPPYETFKVNGTFRGGFDNFITYFNVSLPKASLHFNVVMKPEKSGFAIKSNITADSINLGHYLGIASVIGKTAFKTTVRIKQTATHRTADVKADINFLDLNHYRLHALKLQANYRNDSLLNHIVVNDKHLVMNGEGSIVFDSLPSFNYTLKVLRADFKPLNLSGSIDFSLQSNIVFSFQGFDMDRMPVQLQMTGNVLRFGNDEYPVKKIVLSKYVDNTGKNILHFNSDIATLNLEGNFHLSELREQTTNLLNYYFSPASIKTLHKNDNISLFFVVKEPAIFEREFFSGLKIASGSSIEASANFGKHQINVSVNSKMLSYADIDFRKNVLNIKPRKYGLTAMLSTKYIVLKDSTKDDKTVLGLDSFNILANILRDSLHYTIFWNNNDTLQKNFGNIAGFYLTHSNENIFRVFKSAVYVNDTLWSLSPHNKIVKDSLGIAFSNFEIKRGRSRFSINGRVPRNEHDTLNIDFKKWDLSNFDFLSQMIPIDLEGIVDGGISISQINKKLWMVSDLSIKNLYFNKQLLGDARILNTWDNISHSVFVKSQIVRKGNSGIGLVFSLDGFLYPFAKNNNFDLKVSFNRFKIKAIEPFLKDYISNLEGVAGGKVSISGSLQKPILKGYVNFKRTSLKINYLNTIYSFSNKIVFDENHIDFGSIVLYDTLGNHATLSGGLNHSYFSNPRFDLTVHTNKFLFFDTNRHQNDLYYGTAIAAGDIKIEGPPDDISLRIKAKTDKGTNVIIPLDYTTEILDKDYIVFKKAETDSTEEKTKLKNSNKETGTKYDIGLDMQIKPNAKVKIIMPYDMGDIQSKGNGNLAMNTNSDGDFSLVGDYVVKEGEFNFTIQNLIKKRFILIKGGRISWSGDPYTANLNIKGLYTVKTDYKGLGLVVDSTAGYKTRLKVNCYVILTGSLSEPTMRFEIKFPDLDPDMRRMVYAQLDTTNQALVNQQMISLLVLGSFSFSNTSNISLSSSYYNIISNQLSGMLSQISKDFDVGINYKPGDKISQEEFELALSTQLFNDRLTINGNFGMTYDRSNRSASNLVGDVDINFKITPDGRWLLKAYNHSNINSWYYYNNYDKVSPYTQGAGIAYQKDFNNIAELFGKTRKRKKKTNYKK